MIINSVSFLIALLIDGTAGLANIQCTKQPHCMSTHTFPVTSLLQQSRLFPTQNWRPPASPAKSPRFPSRTAMPSHRSRITNHGNDTRHPPALRSSHYHSPLTTRDDTDQSPKLHRRAQKAFTPTERLLGTGGAAPFLHNSAVKLP